jgi:acyl-CoA reductase-like NAD-dependent aldehyde dehydrogenase
VLDDADFEKTADMIVEGAFSMAGQKCLATSRVAVAAKIAHDFSDILRVKTERLIVGDPSDPRSHMGPMISEKARDRLLEVETEALEMGGRHFLPPAPVAPELVQGYYATPRVLINVPKGSALRRGELYGPILCVYAFKNLDEAVKIANETPYGLSASIATRDLSTALSLAERIEAGIVRVNSATTGLEPHIPVSGAKESGVNSVSFGAEAVEFFSQPQTLYVDYTV